MEDAAGPVLFRVRALRRSFVLHGQTIEVLRGIDLEAHAAEAIAIQGPSGSGKSTLLTILALVDAEYEGAYELEGRDTRTADESRRAAWRLRTIGMAFQDLWLVDSLTAQENLLVPLYAAGTSRAEAGSRASDLLERAGLTHCRARTPRELSGGERRRLGLARALANRPRLLLVDEPTAELDAQSAAAVLALIASARAEGATLVAASHDPALVATCDRRLLLHEGRLVGEAAPPRSM